MMRRADDYIKQIRRKLWIIPADKRMEILKEMESDIRERIANGEREEDIIREMPSPNNLREEYVSIYGVSKIYVSFLILIGISISSLTVSILPFTSIAFYPAPLFLILLSIYILNIAEKYGVKIGAVVSATASIFRLLLFYLTFFLLQPPLEPETDMMEILVSLSILLLPFATYLSKV